MQRTGAQIIWECLVHEGVRTVFGVSRRGDSARLRRDAGLSRSGTSSSGTNRARPIWPTATRAPAVRLGSRLRLRALEPPIWSPASPPRRWIRRRWSASRARCRAKLIGYDAFQETDISGITLPITKHSYLVTRVDEIMPTIKEAFHLAKSGRPGAGARRHHERCAAGLDRLGVERRAGEDARLPGASRPPRSPRWRRRSS